MNVTDLGVLYALGGLVSTLVVRARPARGGERSRWGSLALAFVLWPLWLPVILAAQQPAPRTALNGAVSDTEAALVAGQQAVEGTALEGLLPRTALERMRAEVRRAAERAAELDALLADPSFDRSAAQERLARYEREGASVRALASARSHCENIERLRALRERDRRALEELSELARALRTQLVFARYSGSSAADASDIVSELWARLEVLDPNFDEQPLLSEFAAHERSEARSDRG